MDRRVILAQDVETAAIDVQALAQRLASLGGIRPSVAAHAEQIDVAAKTLRDAAVALNGGLTPNLRSRSTSRSRQSSASGSACARSKPTCSSTSFWSKLSTRGNASTA